MEEWEATPRKIRVSFFIWLADANARRAPLLVRPGSHRAIAEHNSSTLGTHRRYGTSPEAQWAPHFPEGRLHASLAELISAEAAAGPPLPLDSLAPLEAAEGPAGSVTVTTTVRALPRSYVQHHRSADGRMGWVAQALVHTATTNVDSEPRM